MGGEVEANKLKLFVQFILVLSFIGALLIPPLHIYSNAPAFELSDFSFPLLVLITFIYFQGQIATVYKKHKTLIFSFSIFILITIVSIIWNSRIHEIRDWFEVIKYIKFIFFLFLFYIFFNGNQLIKLISIVFIAVFVFNVLHYFNIFDFNQIIEPFYAPPHHLDFFGLNSIGEVATKRALGTLGNPNNNGLLFLLFTICFLPSVNSVKRNQFILLALAILGVFMCQSRTGILAYGLVLISYFITMKSSWQVILILLLLSISYYILLLFMGNIYLNSLGDVAHLKNSGIGRLIQWKKIISAMPNHWIFGHAPDKQYFETNSIYSESEYFLVLFRYGIVGVLGFLSFWWIWLKNYAFKYKDKYKFALYLAIIYLMGAVTNNPLQSPKIALFLGVLMALTLLKIDEQKEAN